ncbi:MAG: hypothetical protein K8R18_09285 [Parvibaculum sp.]|uniref:DUF6655 family protein n=1 Tax=Parvibaculum sp. TaxID=2024848 RepID=UPI0025CEE13A|nr:DUF6655 family protein [Parvibaculum sp.]MCE9649801.1 hypothetical protein [Parvibaculum sp.]
MLTQSLAAATLAALLLALAGCTTGKTSSPPRTATEQLLISTAADRAAKNLALQMPSDKALYIDTSNFDGTDSKYAISAIKAELLRRGGRLVLDRNKADAIVEISSGALSIDESSSIVGIPQFDIPVPAAGNLTFPEIALFKKQERQGIAKFSAFGYDAKSGALLAAAEPDYGMSHTTEWVVALFISWNTSDILPEERKSDEGRYFFSEPLPLRQRDLPNWF